MKDDSKDNRQFEVSGCGPGGVAEDERLGSLLENWQAPDAPASLDARVIASYRRHRLPVWRRMLTATIPVPAPIAAAFAALLLTSSFLAARMLYNPIPELPRNMPPPVQTGVGQIPQTAGATASRAADLQTPPMSVEAGRGGTGASSGRAARNDIGRAVASAGRSEAKPSAIATAPARSHPVVPGKKQFTISLQSGQETIRVVIGSEYRLNPTPKIYAGAIVNQSPERQMP